MKMREYRRGEKPNDRDHRGGEEQRTQTFRRKRALGFLEMLYVKQETLKGQLQREEFANSRPVIEGELKAVEMIIEDFKNVFQVERSEIEEGENE